MDFPKINVPALCLGRDLRIVSRHEILVWSVKYVVTSGNWLQRSFTLFIQIVELQPDVFCCDLFLQLYLISGRDMNSLL